MFTIEKLHKTETTALYNLVKDVPEFHVNASTVNFWPKSILQDAITASDVFIFVAKNEKTIIGFILASYSSGLKKATIENIYVQPEFRGQEVGNLLLTKLIEGLAATGCEYIATLVPLNSIGAEKLYTNAGFSKGECFIWLDKSLSASFDQK